MTVAPSQFANTKRCTTCLRHLPFSAFSPSASSHGGLQGRCKECRAAVQRGMRKRADSASQDKARRLAAMPMYPCVCGCEPHDGPCARCGEARCPEYFERDQP